jgi:ABC-type anion transport system duplicated permease subunit
MLRLDKSVDDLLVFLRTHKIKIGIAVLAIVFGPGLYDDWQKSRAAQQLESDRKSVDTDASVTGMMLMEAWTGCSQIGIVNDMERCAAYQGRLLQEQSAPMLAKLAVEQRASYYKNCQRFNTYEYCSQLLQRSVALSNAQRNSGNN